MVKFCGPLGNGWRLQASAGVFPVVVRVGRSDRSARVMMRSTAQLYILAESDIWVFSKTSEHLLFAELISIEGMRRMMQ